MLPILVAIAIPLLFLFLVWRLDLYASVTKRALIICIVWGFMAFALSYGINTIFARRFAVGVVLVFVAPIVEELIKSLVLVYFVRRPDFTYFVDGAIYGFAVGAAFAILETPYYLITFQSGLALSLMRSFSTSLMHGSTSALVGVALGKMRFGRQSTRIVSLLIGWSAAIGVHITFNRLISQPLSPSVLLQALCVGLGGVLLTALLIRHGLREERRWLHESLGLQLGVSHGEAAVVQQLTDLGALLKPIELRFGPEKRQQVEQFLRLQAQIGLKHKVQAMTPDPALREELADQIVVMRRQVDLLRQAVGVYCLIYVRSLLPPNIESFWAGLATRLDSPRASNVDVWHSLGQKVDNTDKATSELTL
ncbi:MAG: PrsW family intramembrane metalloprotease [Caldilineaceae bacterium]|nr:PrsW family intramembrane metalloprotease [Caldilineaceae bacterium]